MMVIIYGLAWILFATALTATLLYGIFTPWNTHPVGQGFFWSMVGWTTVIFLTNISPLIVAFFGMTGLLVVTIIGYAFMIWALWWGVIQHIVKEQFIYPARKRRAKKKKERANG